MWIAKMHLDHALTLRFQVLDRSIWLYLASFLPCFTSFLVERVLRRLLSAVEDHLLRLLEPFQVLAGILPFQDAEQIGRQGVRLRTDAHGLRQHLLSLSPPVPMHQEVAEAAQRMRRQHLPAGLERQAGRLPVAPGRRGGVVTLRQPLRVVIQPQGLGDGPRS